MRKIVVVEDEVFMREELVSMLEKENYEVACLTEFLHPVEDILKEAPDLIVLDINLPHMSGFEICKAIRQRGTVPVLVLTSRDQLKDELHALNLGADEYLTKPCHKERLLARIVSLLRRSEDRRHFLENGDIRLDLRTYTLEVQGEFLILPENQGKIMELLLANPGEIVTKEMLFLKLWGTTEYVDENALQVNMTRLKRSIGGLPMAHRIVTVRGEGYRLEKIEGENGK